MSLMKQNPRSILLLVFAAVLSGATFGQTQQQRQVVVNGQNGRADVIDQNGRLFVDVSALASIGKGSVSFGAPGIVLTLPAVASGTGTVSSAGPPAASPQPADSSGLSQEF